ncbi:hypothetical protein ACHAXA_007897 [Cyclostephanos tholiformis]|uniref:Uncharacterized protein n=1 Tax=Cyclostephanos tholiformis TaxID=382380 RepID=A0ABD3SH76_9STRA
MSRNIRKKSDIPIPEPRHRVGPKGISSGISFRDLPPPSLDEIKNICDHYKVKCAGTYKSLASRYVYQMATEIDQLVDSLKKGGFTSQESDTTIDDHGYCKVDRRHSKHRSSVSSHSMRNRDKINTVSLHKNRHRSRPQTASANRKPIHQSRHRSRRIMREYPCDSVDAEGDEIPAMKSKHFRSSQTRRNDDSFAHVNLEDQNEEVLRWLREEIRRSQSLIDRSKQLHDAELVGARKEVEKVKKVAKEIIKAVHRKEKGNAAKSEAIAEIERRRRLRTQKILESMIHAHNTQINLLEEALYRVPTREEEKSLRDQARFHPWGELQDNITEVSFSHSDASDLTMVLDDLAEEAYQQLGT